MSAFILAAARLIVGLQESAAAELNASMLEGLRPYHGFVGTWEGSGSSLRSAGWKETLEVTWGFRKSDGRVTLNFYFDGNPYFEAAILAYDPDSKAYQFVARSKSGDKLVFQGKPQGSQGFRFIREGRAKDSLDRLDLKLVRSGDKIVVQIDVKKTRFDRFAEIEWFRVGKSLEEFAEGPRCLITGGAGRVAVEHGGKTYHVACEACKAEFLSRPEKYVK